MKKIKMKSLMLIGIILVSSFIGLSTFVKPGAADLDKTNSEMLEQHSSTSEPHGTIEVPGTTQQTCEPDQLCIYLDIIAFDPNSAAIARDEAARIIDFLLKLLKEVGILMDNIQTLSYSIEPKYEWEDDVRVFKGYKVIVKMKVTLNNFDIAGQVIDNCVNAGALIDSISFELSKNRQNELKTLLMAEAARDAKAKAKAVLDALDEELGNVKSINIGNYRYNPIIIYTYTKGNYDSINSVDSSLITPILPSDLVISASVNIVFEIL